MEQIKITFDENHQQPVVSSLQIAEDFGKQHKHVLESIENIKAENSAVTELFYETTYKAGTGKKYKMYLMNRDGFSLLVMGFTGKDALDWKLKYIKAFNEMEKQIKNPRKLTTEEKVMLSLQYSKEISDRVVTIEEKTDRNSEEIERLGKDARLDPGQYIHVGQLVSARINEIKETRKLSLSKKQNGLLFQGLNHEIKQITGVGTRSDLRQKHYVQVCNFIHTWEPSSATMEKIKALEAPQDAG